MIIEQIKSIVRIEDIIREDGFTLKKAGKSLVAFRGRERTSISIDPEKQIYHRFSRNEGGDIFKWLQYERGFSSFKDALAYLADWAGIKASSRRYKPPKKTVDPEQELLKGFEIWQNKAYHEICEIKQGFENIFRREGYVNLDDSLLPLAHQLPIFEHWLDILFYGTFEQKLELFKSEQVRRWIA